MQVIPDKDRELLKERFETSLDTAVTIKLFSESPARSILTIPGEPETPLSKLALSLAQELADLSPKINLEFYDFYGDGGDTAKEMGVERIPTYIIGDDAKGRVRFNGTPVGNEFATLLVTMEALSNKTPHLSEAVVRTVREIKDPVHIQVFVTPT